MILNTNMRDSMDCNGAQNHKGHQHELKSSALRRRVASPTMIVEKTTIATVTIQKTNSDNKRIWLVTEILI